MAEILSKCSEQEAMPPNESEKVGTENLTCKRLSRDSMIYSIWSDDKPVDALGALSSLLVFVMDCITIMRTSQEFTLSPEGASGLWSMLNIIETGMKEIGKAL
jgi:hypothetical protein